MIKLYDARATDVLPPIVAEDPRVQAFAFALQQQMRRLFELRAGLAVWCSGGALSETMCDVLALELRTPQYDTGMALATKRELVRNTLAYYALAGTKGAVKRITGDIFGSAEVQEWFDYGGEPGYFKVTTDNPAVTDENVGEFRRVAESVKRLSAHLETVELTLTTEPMTQVYGFAIHTGTVVTLRQAAEGGKRI